jgi:hypothetical protein
VGILGPTRSGGCNYWDLALQFGVVGGVSNLRPILHVALILWILRTKNVYTGEDEQQLYTKASPSRERGPHIWSLTRQQDRLTDRPSVPT